jgi:hypothetical protein
VGSLNPAYFSRELLVKVIILGAVEVDGQHTGVNLAKLAIDVLQNYDILKKNILYYG